MSVSTLSVPESPANKRCPSSGFSVILRLRRSREYTFREKTTGDLLAETIFIIVVELAGFDKELDDCVDICVIR